MRVEDKLNSGDGKLPPIRSRLLDRQLKGKISSSFELHNIEEEQYSNQLIPTNDLTEPSRYDDMTEKELIKEHELLVRRLLKYRQLIDIILFKSPRPKKQALKPAVNAGDLLQKQMENNSKIIANHLNDIKEMERVKNQRTMDEVIGEQHQLHKEIARTKKQIFELKNQDVMNSRNLLTDKEVFDKERMELDMGYKFEVKRNGQLKKRCEELQLQLDVLRGKNVQPPRSPNFKARQRYLEKKQYHDGLKAQLSNLDQLMEECFGAKTRRNQGIIKETEAVDRKCRQLERQIEEFENRNDRYWKKE